MSITPSTIEAFPEVSLRPPSAFRKLTTLLVRILGADPECLERQLADEYLAEGQCAIITAAESSANVETLVEKMRRHWTDFWADGVIDPREQRILAQDQAALARAARTTTEQIEQLR